MRPALYSYLLVLGHLWGALPCGTGRERARPRLDSGDQMQIQKAQRETEREGRAAGDDGRTQGSETSDSSARSGLQYARATTNVEL